MTVTLSITIRPDEVSAPTTAAAPRFDGSRLRRIAEITAKVVDLLTELGAIPGLKAAEPPAANV